MNICLSDAVVDELGVRTLLLREHLLVAVSFVVALKLDVHSVS